MALSAHAAPRPNIVFILADDMGYGDLSCYGCKDISTPHIDSLARDGVRLTQFYSNGPECTPTRTGFLTGRYQQRVGGLECAIGTGNVGRYDDAIRLRETNDLGLPTNEMTISRLLKDAGYATAVIGKWHLGYDDKFMPRGHGFDHALYCLGGGMDYFHHVEDPPAYQPVLRLNGKPVKREGYFTDLIADDAVRWLRLNTPPRSEKPFFLYLPFTAPHSPFQAPDEKQPAPLPAGSERWNQGKAPPPVYKAMIERLDRVVGQILDSLREQGVADNTVVVFASDNGGTASARPTGLRGQKGGTFEGGIRVPCIVRWPGILKAGTVSEQVGITMDLTASFARIGGAKLPAGRKFDGIDLLGVLASGKTEPRQLFWRQRRGDNTWKGVRDGSLKYVVQIRGAQQEEYLFDLANDVAEKNDLAKSRAAEVQRIKSLLAAWEKEVRPVR
ncbi:MAG: sulfatase-like hydrolase/transferase [Verrucomicrobiota bacterium]